MRYIHSRYTLPLVIATSITENGFGIEHEASLPMSEAIHDQARQTYFTGYVKELFEAVRDENIDIRGYMAWSLLE